MATPAGVFFCPTSVPFRFRISNGIRLKNFALSSLLTFLSVIPGKTFHCPVDQLNTHKSETLVRLVAKRENLDMALGEKGKSGILQSMASRMAFLSAPQRRIRFIYIPKHTSWLNQIECWFSILVRRLLKPGNFTSTMDLQQQIEAFIEYFNRRWAKPFNWKFKGFEQACKTG